LEYPPPGNTAPPPRAHVGAAPSIRTKEGCCAPRNNTWSKCASAPRLLSGGDCGVPARPAEGPWARALGVPADPLRDRVGNAVGDPGADVRLCLQLAGDGLKKNTGCSTGTMAADLTRAG